MTTTGDTRAEPGFWQLRIFVSSSMSEFAEQRLAIKEKLRERDIDAFVYETDAPAAPESHRVTFLREARSADIYVGIFGHKLGAETLREHDEAKAASIPRLLYQQHPVEARAPELTAFLKAVNDLEKGVTVKRFADQDQLADLVAHDVADLLARTFRAHARVPAAPTSRDRAQLLNLLQQVEETWIDGLLRSSLHGEVAIAIRKKYEPEAIESRWNQVAVLPAKQRPPIVASDPPLEVYRKTGPFLLILGEPGGGKTTTLLELARDLAHRAPTDASAPIPVVLNLSTFDPEASLDTWMAKEISIRYTGIPASLAKRWLSEARLLPLLDGFDEVPEDRRSACLEAIDSFLSDPGAPGLVVSSRVREYMALQPKRLRFSCALMLEALTDEQIDRRLQEGGPELARLRAMLSADASMRELARSPLMLDVMVLTHGGETEPAALPSPSSGTGEARQSLFDAYVEAMFRRKPANPRYPKDRLLGWLTSLAQGMSAAGESEFLVERLQPSWLRRPLERVVYFFATRILMGVTGGVALLGIAGVYDGKLTGATITSGALVGVAAALLDLRWFLRGARRRADLVRILWLLSTTVVLVCAGQFNPFLDVVGVRSLIFDTPFVWSIEGTELARVLVLDTLIFAAYALPIASRRYRTSANDVRAVEIVAWSWEGVAPRVALGLSVTIACLVVAGVRFRPAGEAFDLDGNRIAKLRADWPLARLAMSEDGTRVLARDESRWPRPLGNFHVYDLIDPRRSFDRSASMVHFLDRGAAVVTCPPYRVLKTETGKSLLETTSEECSFPGRELGDRFIWEHGMGLLTDSRTGRTFRLSNAQYHPVDALDDHIIAVTATGAVGFFDASGKPFAKVSLCPSDMPFSVRPEVQGRSVIVRCSDQVMWVLDANTGRVSGSIGAVEFSPIRRTYWAPSGKRFAACARGQGVIADANPTHMVARVPCDATASFSFAPDGKAAAFASKRGHLYLWRENAGTLAVETPSRVSGVQWNARGDRILVREFGVHPILLLAADGSEVTRLDPFPEPRFLGEGRRILLRFGDRLSVCDAENGHERWSVSGVRNFDNRSDRLVVAYARPRDERPLAVIPFLLTLLWGVVAGIRPRATPTPARVNEGMRLSLRNALLGAIVGAAVGIGITAAAHWFGSNSREVSVIYTAVMAMCLLGGLDVVQHLILRLGLWTSGQAPIRYLPFLEESVRLVFLRRVGGGFVFIHRTMLEHFRDRRPAGRV